METNSIQIDIFFVNILNTEIIFKLKRKRSKKNV